MLTDTRIRAIKPGSKLARYFDSKGLFLEVKPTGAKSWVFRYHLNKKEHRMGLGPYPEVSLAEARELRDQARKLLKKGIDPIEHRRRERAEAEAARIQTFEVIAREWFDKFSLAWAPSHACRIIARLEKYVFPHIGQKGVRAITALDVLDITRRIEARGTFETARRVATLVSQVMRFAIQTGRADRNPATDVRGAIPTAKPKHFPAVLEPNRLGGILRAIDSYEQGTPTVHAALRLAPLLAVRPGELRHMKWADIDWEARQWTFVLAKTKQAHIVPLSRQALIILAELWPITRDSQWCFPSERSKDRPISDMALTAALRRLGIPRDELVVHGFRAAFRTLSDEILGFRPDIIEHQLGHRTRNPLGYAYARTEFIAERRELMQKYADLLEQFKEGSWKPTNS